MPPPVPQAALAVPATQVPLEQHWPDVQQDEVPHAVVPLGHTHWQLAFNTLGGVHAVTQALVLGQTTWPLGHTHEPLWHTRPPEQAVQVPPPVPQAWAVLPGWQVPFWQHWVEEQQDEVPHAVVLGGHTHVPFTQASEPGHATGVCTHWLATQLSVVHGSLSLH